MSALDYFETEAKSIQKELKSMQKVDQHKANTVGQINSFSRRYRDDTAVYHLDSLLDQLSKVKTLYKAELDEELEAEIRAKGFGHLLDDEPKDEP